MLNKSILQGRLVADPELRHTQSGAAVATFRIACDRGFKSNDPNAQNADFISIVAWRQTAEFVSRYFTKGRMILIDGRIQVREYTDNNGQKRYVTEVIAENVNFCGSKKESGGGNYSGVSYGGDGVPTYQEPSGGGYSAKQGYGGYNQQPYGSNISTNDFAELTDDDGELPW